MSMGHDSLWLTIGFSMTISALVAIFRPASLVNESLRNRDARLSELDAGAPDAFFEERRSLEAYPPRFNPTHQTLRRFGVAGLVLGVLCIFKGLN